MSVGRQKPISVAIVGFDDEARDSIAQATEELGFHAKNFYATELGQWHDSNSIESVDVLLVQKKAIQQYFQNSEFQKALLKRRSGGKFNGLFGLAQNTDLPARQNRFFHSFVCVRHHNKGEQKKILLSFFENVRLFLGQSQL